MTTPLPFDTETITESHLNTFHYRSSPVEHTLIFNRPGEEVDLAVQHFENNHEVHLVTFNIECGEPTTIHEEFHLSYAEARMLRDLLCRPEVANIIEEDFH